MASSAQFTPASGVTIKRYGVGIEGLFRLCSVDAHGFVYVSKPTDGGLRLVRHYFRTGADVDLRGANKLLGDPVNDKLPLSDILVSPGGTWVMWRGQSGSKGGYRIARMNGSDRGFIEVLSVKFAAWATSSDKVIYFTNEGEGLPRYTTIRVYDLNSLSLARIYKVSPDSGLAGNNDGLGHVFMLCYCPLGGENAIVASGVPLPMMRIGRYGLGGTVGLSQYDLNNNARPIRTYTVNLPPKSDFLQAVLSPDEQCVVWQVGFASTTELWASEIDGTHMRRIVSTKFPSGFEHMVTELPIEDIIWLPTGSAIACRFGNVVYDIHFDVGKR
jgi:hypothetical protein